MTRPDTSLANIARVLREAATKIDAMCHKDIRRSFHERNFAQNDCRALADALAALPPSMTWEERVNLARRGMGSAAPSYTAMDGALRFAFPEMAP